MSWKLSLLAATLLAVTGCAEVATTQSGAVGIERKQTMLLSSQEVEQASAKSYAQELSKVRGAGRLNSNPVLTARVRNIANRLIAQTPVFRPDARNWRWEVNVADSPELNAYAMAGGKVMVYSGLITQLSLTDDELAAVIGHEMAHALREHSREQMSQAYAQQMGLSVVGALAGFGQGGMDLASLAGDLVLTKPMSRTMESEADVIGLELMARAGYNPNAALSVWRKMMAMGNGNGPEFLSTHPSDSRRLQELSTRIPRVMPLYEAARRH